jgi:hypothetical protein
MATYKLQHPAYLVVEGHPSPQHFRAGSIVTVPDDALPPASTSEPLDAAAIASKAKHEKSFTVMANGFQTVDRASGKVMITRHNERTPKPAPPKPGAPVRKARAPEPHTTSAQAFADSRNAIFEGKDPAPQADNDLIASEKLRDALERAGKRKA